MHMSICVCNLFLYYEILDSRICILYHLPNEIITCYHRRLTYLRNNFLLFFLLQRLMFLPVDTKLQCRYKSRQAEHLFYYFLKHKNGCKRWYNQELSLTELISWAVYGHCILWGVILITLIIRVDTRLWQFYNLNVYWKVREEGDINTK